VQREEKVIAVLICAQRRYCRQLQSRCGEIADWLHGERQVLQQQASMQQQQQQQPMRPPSISLSRPRCMSS